jgi:Flp pilus assembly protein TadD
MTMRALEKDDKLAEAHVSLAAISRDYDWNWPEAELHFKRAIELNPNSPEARQLYGLFLAYIARSDESVAEAERAVELDPLSPQRNVFLGEVLYVRRRYDQAIEQLRKTLELESNHWFAHFLLGLTYTQKGMSEEATSELEKARDLSRNRMDIVGVLGYAYAQSGKKAEAQKLLNEVHRLSKSQYIPPICLAIIHIGLGDKDNAFASLERVFEDRQWHVWLLKSEPLFDSLRSDPRFTELLKRAGFAPLARG